LKYSAEEYTVRSGTIEISLGSQGGTHTLVFDDPSLSGFELIDPSGPMSGTVTLEPGSYTIYCQIPGHRAAGMEATIVATP
jgi:plastocyanin